MKKILFTLVMLCTAAAKALAVDVATANDLKDAIEADNGADIKLTANIDVSGLGKLCETFTGTIDGNTNSGRGWALIGATEPLFDQLKGATLKNIVIQGFNINQPEASLHAVSEILPCYGMIASVAKEGCKFENVLMEGCDLRNDCSIVGGFVGYSDGSTFSDCSVDNHSALYSKVSIYQLTYQGVLVGESKNDTFRNCVNGALIAACNPIGIHIGGIAGFAQETKMESCLNYGIAVAVEDVNYPSVYEAYKNGNLPATSMSHRGKNYLVQSLSDALSNDLYYAMYIGGLVGFSSSCELVDCVNLGPCYDGWDEGGIVGCAQETNFDLCINYGTIYGRAMGESHNRYPNRGGIAGTARNNHITNCLNFGTFPGLEGYCGGIAQSVRTILDSSTISNCFSAVAGVPIFGSADELSTESGNNYAIGSELKEEDMWMYVTQDMLSSGIVTYWLNKGLGNHDREVKSWRQNIGQDTHPVLDPDHDVVSCDDLSIPITNIGTRQELKAFAERVNDGAVFENARLTADIVLDITEPVIIGTEEHPYRGIFDGAGHTIDNQVFWNTKGAAGTFRTVGSHAEIRNLTIGSASQIAGYSGAGGIVGEVRTQAKWGFVTIEKCGNKGSIIATDYGGGILGKVDCAENIKVYVNHCYNVGEVRVYAGNSAQLCGYMKNSGVVTNSWAYARLRADDDRVIPFGTNETNGQMNHFVGYDKTLDISVCYTFDSETNVDKWQRSKLQDGVYEYPGQMLNSGTFVYLLNGETNDPTAGLTWQQNLGSYPEPGNKGLYHTREVANLYGTLCLPYKLRSNDDIQYYTFTTFEADQDMVSLHFEATDEVEASKPALFRVKETGTYSFSDVGSEYIFFPSNNDEETEWKMLGTYEQKVFTENTNPSSKEIYFVSGGSIHNAKNTTIAPYRAYIQGPSIETLTGNDASGAKSVKFVLDGEHGETAALQVIGEDLVPVQQGGKSYSLMGTEVGDDYRGLVVKKGKKMIQY